MFAGDARPDKPGLPANHNKHTPNQRPDTMTTMQMPSPETIKEFRAKHEVTNLDLAVLLGCSAADLSRHINSQAAPDRILTAAEPLRKYSSRHGLSILIAGAEFFASLPPHLQSRVEIHIPA